MNEAYLIELRDLMKYEGDVFIEFRQFPDANRHCESMQVALWWADRLMNHYNLTRFVEFRFWSGEPTKEQMEQTGWETDAIKEAKTE